jgi:hypothetical protein
MGARVLDGQEIHDDSVFLDKCFEGGEGVADEERAADAAIDLHPGVFRLPLTAKPLC